MSEMTLYVGNKTYSSWSLRGYLPLRHAGADFDEVVIPFEGAVGVPTPRIAAIAPAARVPFLKHGDVEIWDSLAIGEYAAEMFPEARLLPDDRVARGVMRSCVAEMHSGFAALRSAMPMNLCREPFALPVTSEVLADVTRIKQLWKSTRARFGAAGPFLFGQFTLADAAFAPVATRFRTYGVVLDEAERAYVDAIYALPAMRAWIADAKKEPWRLEHYERVGRAGVGS